MPMPGAAITPIPPSLATADAKPEREIPTAMPPWIMGKRAMCRPIFKQGSLRSFKTLSVSSNLEELLFNEISILVSDISEKPNLFGGERQPHILFPQVVNLIQCHCH